MGCCHAFQKDQIHVLNYEDNDGCGADDDQTIAGVEKTQTAI